MSSLERAYRRLLIAYPRWYRARRGDEIVGTVMEAARPGQRHPRPSETLHLIVHGVAVRAGFSADGALGNLFGAAAAPALASAGVFALFLFVFGEWAPWPGVHVPAAHFGPFLTIGPVVYVAWMVAAVVDVTTRSPLRRTLVVLAVAVTALAVPIGNASPGGRPPFFVLVALAVLGLPALLRPDVTRSRLDVWPSLGAGLATLTLLVAVTLPPVLGSRPYADFGLYNRTGFYRAGVGALDAWLPLLAVVMLTGAAAALRGSRLSRSRPINQ